MNFFKRLFRRTEKKKAVPEYRVRLGSVRAVSVPSSASQKSEPSYNLDDNSASLLGLISTDLNSYDSSPSVDTPSSDSSFGGFGGGDFGGGGSSGSWDSSSSDSSSYDSGSS